MDSHDQLARRARRAYEVGRARHAIVSLWPLAPITIGAALLGDATTTLALALGLAIVCGALIFAGRGLERSVGPGWRAGIVPMVAALAMWQGQGCAGECSPHCAPLCSVTGVVVGAWLGMTLLRRERPAIAFASLVVAGLTASMGCAPLGLLTVAGAIAGLAVGLVPTVALHRLARG